LRAEATEALDIAEEDALRAHTYNLLARLLARAPTRELLAVVRELKGDETPFGSALTTLGQAARKAGMDSIEDEYFQLFIGVGRSELLPYGSYYLTGFMNDWPAARLVDDMRKLGVVRAAEVKEPEDHIGALCEMMSGLITGAFGAPLDLMAQREFFETHIGNWAPTFFADLEAAKSAAFYMPVGTIGRLFMEIETEGFRMAA